MRIGTKISIGLALLIGVGSLAQAALRLIVEGNQEQEILRNVIKISANRLANALIVPIWGFDNTQIETVIRLELADPNLLAVELQDSLGQLTSLYTYENDEIRKVNFDAPEKQSLLDLAISSQSMDIVYQNNTLATVTVYATDRVLREKLVERLTYNGLYALLFAAALLIGISWMLRSLVVRPVADLTRVVTSSETDLSVRSSYRSSDEIGTLSDRFNKMLDTLQEYTESLEEKVQERTRELAEANEVLRQQKEEMERNLRIAQKIQLKLIPNENTYPKREELSFSSLYTAMDAIGGDIFDIIRTGRHSFGLLMADVSGHGVPAALVTAMAKVSFNTHAQAYGVRPAEVCAKVNHDIASLLGDDYSHYLTAFFGILDLEKSTFIWSNCGHHPAILLRGEQVIRLGSPGPFIGFVEDAEFFDESIEIRRGDRIILFTDGIVEARNAKDEQFDIDRLIQTCLRNRTQTAAVFIKNLLHELKVFCGDEKQDDDRAVLVVDYLQKVDAEGHATPEVDIQAGKLYRSERKELKAHLQEVAVLIKSQRYQDAHALAQELYSEHPDNVQVVSYLSLILYRLGQYERALEVLKKAYDQKVADDNVKAFMAKIQEKLDSL